MNRCDCARIIVFAALLWAAPGFATGNDGFARGVALSRAGEFPEAAAAFEASATNRPAAGTLVNLGLAEWQRGRAGAAILAWERARWLDPFETRAEANLQFAREVAQVPAPELKWHETVSTWLPPDAWLGLGGAMLWLGLGLLLLPGVWRRPRRSWQQWGSALAFGLVLFSLAANVGVVSRTRIGFVVHKNAPLQLTPTQAGEVLSTLAAGEPGRQLRRRGNYLFIRTAGGAGWVDRRDFQLICPR